MKSDPQDIKMKPTKLKFPHELSAKDKLIMLKVKHCPLLKFIKKEAKNAA